MGLYSVQCPECKVSHMWFSGNAGDQRCQYCIERSKPKEVEVFMDGIDWQHEIGEASGGNTVYGSEEDLKENNRCWKGCGIVKCKVIFDSWVQKQDWNVMYGGSSKTYTKKDFENNKDIIRFEAAKKRLAWLDGLVKKQKMMVKRYKKLADKSLNKKEKKNVIK